MFCNSGEDLACGIFCSFAANYTAMPNPTTKQELLAAMTDGYAQLNEQIAKMSDEEASATCLSTSTNGSC